MFLNETVSTNRIKVKVNEDVNNDVDVELMNLVECQSINNDYYNLRRKFILAQHDSIVSESYMLMQESNNSFLKGIISILKRFIDLVNKMFNSFLSSMNNLKNVLSLYFNKNNVDVTRLSTENIFFEGFKFTLNAIPQTNLNALTNNGPFIFNENIIKELSTSHILLVEENSRDEYYYDKIRGKIIDYRHAITKEKFKEAISQQLRGGMSKAKNIFLNEYSTPQNIYQDLINYKDYIKEIKKDRDETIKIYKELINYFNSAVNIEVKYSENEKSELEKRMFIKQFSLSNDVSIKTSEGLDLKYDKDLYDKIKKYTIARSAEAKNISQIISEVYSCKIEACKDKYKQDFDILKRLILEYK